MKKLTWGHTEGQQESESPTRICPPTAFAPSANPCEAQGEAPDGSSSPRFVSKSKVPVHVLGSLSPKRSGWSSSLQLLAAGLP